ncbi:hypothetical protein GG344DRAFT_61763 [Lentinula edodes]|nr:hypothetical protein GG344DRAFT_61763 [Lentinula edodes]
MSESLQLAIETQIGMNWNHYIQLVESTIVIYDYLLTFDTEVELYWKQRTRFTFATTLFYVNRYFNLLGLIPATLFDFWPEFIVHHMVNVLLSMFITGVIFFWFRPSSTVCVAGNSFFQLHLASKVIEKVDYASPLINQVGCADIISGQQ